jgi:hypothetical protein
MYCIFALSPGLTNHSPKMVLAEGMDDWLKIRTFVLSMASTYEVNTRVVESSKNFLCDSTIGPATAEIKHEQAMESIPVSPSLCPSTQ